jgi:hypothetical protein
MTDNEIRNLFAPLWADVQGEGRYPNKRPLLAHYTKVPVLESILRNNEIWFSHPLLMNDPQEVIFGLDVGVKLLLANEKIKAACGSPGRFERLKNPLFIGSTSLQRGNFQTLLGCVFQSMRRTTTMGCSRCGAGTAIREEAWQSCSIRRRLFRGTTRSSSSRKCIMERRSSG